MAKQAQHKKLYEYLRSQIQEGIFPVGTLIPSENELCAAYKVTRPTVRLAIDKLFTEGYIQKHQGKGSVVRSNKKGLGILSVDSTTRAAGEDVVLHTKIVVSQQLRSWPEPFVFLLTDKEKKASCIYFERSRKVADEVVLYETTRFPANVLVGFENIILTDKSLFDILRNKYGISILGGEQKIWAKAADVEISQKLLINLHAPVLYLERRISTSLEGFYIYSTLYCNTDAYHLHSIF